MEIKHFDYQEFVKVKSKSLNCESCGGGLVIINDSKTCDCSYCGNTNMILDDGKTKIVEKVVVKPPPVPKQEGQPSGMSKAAMIGIMVLGVVCIGAVAYYYLIKKRTENEKDTKRKRLLLLNN